MNKEELIKLYQTHRLYIFPCIVALSSLILIVFIIIPQATKLIANQQVEAEISSKSQFMEVKAQTLETYNPADLKGKVDYALGAYPTNRDFVYALSLLQNLVISSGFTTVSVTLEGSPQQGPESKIQSYNVKMELLGQGSLLSPLLTNIENSPRIIRVGSVEITAGRTPQETAITIVVEVLYSSAPSNLGSVDSPLPKISQDEEEVINQLTNSAVQIPQPITQTSQLGPRGKPNPFE